MRLSSVVAVFAAPSVLAFPWMTPGGMDALLNHPDARNEILRRLQQGQTARRDVQVESRQLGTGLIKGLVTLLGGTLQAVLDPLFGIIPTDESVDGLRRFPEPDHPFVPPGPTDQRGPCPGLNTLANHGYLPRNGITTIGQIIAATNYVFNMSPELSALLAGTGVYSGGDILSQKVSIGGADDRVGLLNGLLNGIFGTPSGVARHGTFNEGDASATRRDFYLGGDNISFRPELFKQMHQQALAKGDGTYSVDAMKEHFKNRYAASKAANPQFYFNIPSAIGVMGAYYFVPGFLSNGTIGEGGVANEASITSFYGAKPTRDDAWNDPNLEYTHVPERIPEQGWYRRKHPMTVLEAAAGILDIYAYAKPPIGGAGADQSWVVGPALLPNNPQALSCFIYNAAYANLPSELFNVVTLLTTVVNFLSSTLSPGYLALGCPINYPDATGNGWDRYDEWRKEYVGDDQLMVGSRWYKD